ncbi:uncharacterized protein LOC114184773 [Vigna unguiculata]|uniref:Uncharacterized protein n=1 Tax=Vigna unguiculata TaxID=3917 RepID=A0A4D6N9M2_VIGUN|nr:uncharacterized protein LOC114184773 [Vigna unguiculata]QCE09189.1 hypothetical protein DEO72_LG10g408 [Vigna unguiculata]
MSEEQRNLREPSKSPSTTETDELEYTDPDVKSVGDLSATSPVAKNEEKESEDGNTDQYSGGGIRGEGPSGVNSAHNDTDVEIDAVNDSDKEKSEPSVDQVSSSSSNSAANEPEDGQVVNSPTKRRKTQ